MAGYNILMTVVLIGLIVIWVDQRKEYIPKTEQEKLLRAKIIVMEQDLDALGNSNLSEPNREKVANSMMASLVRMRIKHCKIVEKM